MFPEEQKGYGKGTNENGGSTIHWSTTHPKEEKNEWNKSSNGLTKKTYDIVPQSWIIDSLKMYTISGEVIKFIEKIMKNKRVKLTAGGKGWGENQERDFLEEAQLLLQFIIVMKLVNLILRKSTGKYKIHKSQENINYFVYMLNNNLSRMKKNWKP